MYAGPPVEIIGVLIVTAAGFIKQSSKPSNPGTTAHQSAEYSQHQVWFNPQKCVGFHKKRVIIVFKSVSDCWLCAADWCRDHHEQHQHLDERDQHQHHDQLASMAQIGRTDSIKNKIQNFPEIMTNYV